MDARVGWYLVLTKPRHETVAKMNLQHQGFEIYLPLLQQPKRRRNVYQIVTEPLFPRYLFIYLRSEIDDWSKIRSTRGCVALVRFGALPAHVPNALIDKLKLDEISRFNQPQPIVNFQPGDCVRVLDGMLANYEGIVKSKNSRERITLLLNITEHHTRCVNLSIHQLEKIN